MISVYFGGTRKDVVALLFENFSSVSGFQFACVFFDYLLPEF